MIVSGGGVRVKVGRCILTEMQFLTISHRRTGFTDADFAARVADEVRQARALYAQGAIRQIWHRADIPGACILWEAESEEHARSLLSTLPFAQAGMLEVSIVPLKPYAGFSPGPA
jgi:muconolactone delta-isomerase